MKTIRTAVAAAALVAALAGCGTPVAGSAAPQPAPPAPPPTTAPVDPAADRQAVEAVFRDYYDALLARDFTTACSFNAPETTAQLLANVAARGITASTCEEALAALYAIPGAAAVGDQVVNSATVEDVTVTGDAATITWSSELRGVRTSVTSELRRIDGRWRLVDTGT